MEEAFDNAISELKRVDHLFYVSLKYTRTADMMKHVIERLVNTLSFGFEALLIKAKNEKRIEEIPSNLGLRAKLMLETYPDEEMKDYVNFYVKLRKILRAEFTKREEFRRHVTMTVILDKDEVTEVNIDILKEYYDKAKAFAHLLKNHVHGEEDL